MQKLEGSAALMALLLFEPFKPIMLLLFFLQSTLMLIMSMSEGGSGH